MKERAREVSALMQGDAKGFFISDDERIQPCNEDKLDSGR
jgi:hypothetical protein